MKKIILLLFCMPLLLATTCEDDENDIVCTTEAVAGLNVTVIDSETNIPLVEEVVVTAADGVYQETLDYFPGLEYVFSGAWERPGNYIITVSKPGYQTYTSSVITVTSDVCHVIPQQIEVALVAN